MCNEKEINILTDLAYFETCSSVYYSVVPLQLFCIFMTHDEFTLGIVVVFTNEDVE